MLDGECHKDVTLEDAGHVCGTRGPCYRLYKAQFINNPCFHGNGDWDANIVLRP